MFAISTMMTAAFRYFSAITAPTATKAAVVPSSAPFVVTLPQEKPVAKRPFDNNNSDDDEQPRKRRKVQCENSILEPVAQASMNQLTTAFGQLEISAAADTAMEDLTGSFSKLSLATKSNNSSAVDDLVRSFNGLAISNTITDSAMEKLSGRFSKLSLATKSNDRSAADDLVISFNGLAISNISSKGNDTAKNAIRNDSVGSDSCYMMDVFDDDKTDIDNNDDDDMMDIDSGYMMDMDTDDETERMDTTE